MWLPDQQMKDLQLRLPSSRSAAVVEGSQTQSDAAEGVIIEEQGVQEVTLIVTAVMEEVVVIVAVTAAVAVAVATGVAVAVVVAVVAAVEVAKEVPVAALQWRGGPPSVSACGAVTGTAAVLQGVAWSPQEGLQDTALSP